MTYPANYKLTFGKHKDEALDEVPADYLDWLRGQPWAMDIPAVEQYLRENKKHIDKELHDRGNL